MTGAGAVTVNGAPRRLNVTVLRSLLVVIVSLTGRTCGLASQRTLR
jgi:hypothetical protein